MPNDTLTIRHASWQTKFFIVIGLIILTFKLMPYGFGDSFQWLDSVELLCGTLFLIWGLWCRKNPYVTVSEDTLTIHRILLKNKVIPLADLTRIGSYAGDVRLFCGDSKTTLDRSKIDTADHQTLMAFLQQAVPEAEFSV